MKLFSILMVLAFPLLALAQVPVATVVPVVVPVVVSVGVWAWVLAHWIGLLPVIYFVIDQLAYWLPQFPGNGILHSVEIWLKGSNPPPVA